jgi:isopropylmalate/homocitrate/citramalate synthase
MTVKIVEVGPRDGLQYEALATEMSAGAKLQFIKMLVAAGLRHIEAGSFVKHDKVPQMANSAELARLIAAETWPDDVEFSWLTPHIRGFEDAMKIGAREVAVFIAANDGFSSNNINSTIEKSLEVIAPVMKEAATRGIKVRGYVSTIFSFNGKPTPPEKVGKTPI